MTRTGPAERIYPSRNREGWGHGGIACRQRARRQAGRIARGCRLCRLAVHLREEVHRGAFPAAVSAPVQYGAHSKAAVVQLTYHHMLPLARTGELMGRLVRPADVRPTPKGLLMAFAETLIHDGWKPYRVLACTRGLCNAHHLRELTYVFEQMGQALAKCLFDLLLAACHEVAAVGAPLPAERIAYYRTTYDQILTTDEAANPRPPPSGKRGRTSCSGWPMSWAIWTRQSGCSTRTTTWVAFGRANGVVATAGSGRGNASAWSWTCCGAVVGSGCHGGGRDPQGLAGPPRGPGHTPEDDPGGVAALGRQGCGARGRAGRRRAGLSGFWCSARRRSTRSSAWLAGRTHRRQSRRRFAPRPPTASRRAAP